MNAATDASPAVSDDTSGTASNTQHRAPAPAQAATTRFEEKREAILGGAARHFNERGIRGTSLAEVARSVGLVTNSLTYYYRRKDDLAAACMHRAIEVMRDAARTAAGAGDLEGRLRGFMRGYFAVLADIERGARPDIVVFSDMLSFGEPHRTPLFAAYDDMFRTVRSLLNAPGAPVLPRPALNARAHLLLSQVIWARAWLPRWEPADHGHAADALATVLLEGLAMGEVPLPDTTGSAALAFEEADDDRQAAYLRAATRQVNELGYHGASVERIATELGLTKGSFYHHHATKESLIAACFDRTFAVMRRYQDQASAQPGSGLVQLTAACRGLMDFQMSPAGPLLRISAWNALPEAIRLDKQQVMTRLGDRFARLLVAGMADGSLRVLDQVVAAQAVNGMVNAAAEVHRWVQGLDSGNAFALYASPLFTGLRRS